MAENSNIEWTDTTWNPIAGCSIISPGCHNCYAMRMAARLSAMGQRKYDDTVKRKNGKAVWTGKIVTDEAALTQPLRWRKPRRVFVNSMSDLFHEGVPEDFIDQVFGAMGACEDAGLGHTFQILTKRAARMLEYMSTRGHKAWNSRRLATEAYPPRNVWLGVSVEDQARADERIPLLLQTPAAVRFLSCEPLLGPVDLAKWIDGGLHRKCDRCGGVGPDGLRCSVCDRHATASPAIDWIIVGGESGPGARPMNLAWACSIVEQCKASGVACFVKQMGSRPVALGVLEGREHAGEDLYPIHYEDRKGGNPAEWLKQLQVRQFPETVQA